MIGVAVESVKSNALRLEQVAVGVPVNIHGATVQFVRPDLVAVEPVGVGWLLRLRLAVSASSVGARSD